MGRSPQAKDLADAFVSVPGAHIEVWDTALAAGNTVASSTWEDVDPTNLNVQFSVPVAGKYLFRLKGQAEALTSGCEARWRLLFNGAGVVGGTNAHETSHGVGSREEFSIEFPPVDLPAGLETVKLQWQRISGGGTLQVDTVSGWHLSAILISGSGAGGTIVTKDQAVANEVVAAATYVIFPTPNYYEALSVAIEAIEGEWVKADFSGWCRQLGAGSAHIYCHIQLDGSNVTEVTEKGVADNSRHNISHSAMIGPLTKGPHTIRVVVAVHNNLDTNFQLESANTADQSFPQLTVTQFRGGQIPWELDGVEKSATPRAINIIGGALSLADDGSGKLNVELPKAVASAGELKQILHATLTGARLSTGSWTEVEDGTTEADFTIDKESTFEVIMDWTYFGNTSHEGYYRLIFDRGGLNGHTEQIIGGDADDQWQVSGNSAFRKFPTRRSQITLAPGTHRVEIEWRHDLDELNGNTFDHYTVWLRLMSGSGAGGEIGDSYTFGADDNFTITTTWYAPNDGSQDLQVSVPVSGPSDVVHIGGIVAYAHGLASGALNVLIGVGIDGADPVAPYWHYKDSENVASNNEDSVALNLRFTGLQAGTRTFRVMVKRVTGADQSFFVWGSGNGQSHLHATVYRGGLVPIRADGVTKIDKPAALNFLGADVQNAGGVANISLPAAVTTSGESTKLFQRPSVQVDINSTSYKAFLPDTGSLQFEALSAGLHKIELIAVGWMPGGGSTSSYRFKIEIDGSILVDDDGGGTDPNDSWLVRINPDSAGGDYEEVHFVGYVELAAGNHTLVASCKQEAAGNTLSFFTTATVRPSQVNVTSISGSGAGGVIVTTAELASTFVISSTTVDPGSSPNWQYIDNGGGDALTLNIDTADEDITLSLIGCTEPVSSAFCTHWLGLEIDGVVVAYWIRGMNSNGGMTWSQDYTHSFAQGSHTIKVVGSRHTSNVNVNVYGVDGIRTENGFQLVAKQARGGLVPVRQDGATVLDKPAAFDFVNAQVTNVGGVAKVNLLGSEGLELAAEKILSSDYGIVTLNTWEKVDNGGGDDLEVTFETAEGEVVLIQWNGVVFNSSAHEGGMRVNVDGSTYLQQTADAPVAAGGNAKIAVANSVALSLAAGTHTAFVEVFSSNAAAAVNSGSDGSRIQVLRFKGGYVLPENVPIFERDASDTSLILAKAGIGASSLARLALNDGQIRTASLPLTCDIDTTGIGGRESTEAAAAAGDLYHLFAVVSDTDSTQFKLVLSKDATPGTDGPASFSVFRYLWTLRVDTIGPVVIEEFYMSEDGWYEPRDKKDPNYQIYSENSSTPGTIGSWVDISSAYQALVPEGVKRAKIRGLLAQVSSGSFELSLAAEASPSWTPAGTFPFYRFLHLSSAIGVGGTSEIEHDLLLPTRELAYYWRFAPGNILADVFLVGYHNSLYPGASGGTQAQAQYLPDTKGMKGTWATGTTVNFAARPGQPSTSRWTAQSGKQRTASGTLAWDNANNVADLGWDEAASQAAGDKWIYFYQVPKSGADDQFTIRASDNPPGTGPAGYTDFKLVWATYRSAAVLLQVYQRGNVFQYTNKQLVVNGGAGDASLVTASLTTTIPDSAGEAQLTLYVVDGNLAVHVDGETTGDFTAAVCNTVASAADFNTFTIPTPTSPKQIQYSKSISPTTADIYANGWIDEWIDP